MASPLNALRAAASGTATRVPRLELGVVGGPSAGRVGVGGQAADHAHRQDLGLALRPGIRTVAVRRDVRSLCSFAQARPPVSASSARQVLLGLGHLVGGGLGGPAQGVGVVGGLLAAVDELVERRARRARRSSRLDSVAIGAVDAWYWLQRAGRGVVAGVGADVAVQVGADQAHLLVEPVDLGEQCVEGSDVGVGHRAGLAPTDPELVELRVQATEVRRDGLGGRRVLTGGQ